MGIYSNGSGLIRLDGSTEKNQLSLPVNGRIQKARSRFQTTSLSKLLNDGDSFSTAHTLCASQYGPRRSDFIRMMPTNLMV